MSEIKTASLKSSNKSLWVYGLVAVIILAVAYFIFQNTSLFTYAEVKEVLGSDFVFYLLVGLGAQLVDGTLGMAYGATSTSFLLSLGVPPAVSSASVHVAEIFTTGASAVSHYKFKNINKKLLKSLIIPGVLGAVAGAYLLSDVIDGDFIKPFISAYLVFLGVLILKKAFAKNIEKKKTKRIGLLAGFGGFMDSIGGGGWGPIVTSTLLGQGRNPRYTIGSVNAAEFVVTFASGITFLIFTGISSWQVVLGLIIGGVIAAPFGAYFVHKIKRKPLMIIVGLLVIGLSFNTIYRSFF